MNITLQIILEAPRHEIADEKKRARRNVVGDLVNVYSTKDVGKPNLLGRLGFLHVTNVPEEFSLEKLKDKLLRPVFVGSEIIFSEVAQEEVVRKKSCRVAIRELPVENREELFRRCETTISWGLAKPLIRQKQIVSRRDSAQDAEVEVRFEEEASG